MVELLSLIRLPEITKTMLSGRFDLIDLPSEGDERDTILAEKGGAVRGIVTGSRGYVTEDLLIRLPALEHVACFTAGQDFVDIPAVEKRGIRLTNNSAALAESVADLAMGLLLAVARDIPGADAHVRAGKWPDGRYGPGGLLAARRMGIVGLGHIGQGIARRAAGFGTEIGYFGRSQKDVPYRFFDDLAAMAEWANLLVLSIPGGPQTDGIVTADILKALGPDGWFINVARGSVVDQDALITALQNGTIDRAGLDVFAREPHVPQALIGLPNVVLSPHQGSNTKEALEIRSRHLLSTLLETFGE